MDDEAPPVSDEALEAVTEAMVALHARYHVREPASARTRMMGEDMLACLPRRLERDAWPHPGPSLASDRDEPARSRGRRPGWLA